MNFGGIQEKQNKSEGEIGEVKIKLMTVNKAVQRMQKIVKELKNHKRFCSRRDSTNAEDREGIQQKMNGIKGYLPIAQDISYSDCLKINVGL